MSKSFPAFRLKHAKLCAFVLAIFMVMSSETTWASPTAPTFVSGSAPAALPHCSAVDTTADFSTLLSFTDLNSGATDTITVISGPTPIGTGTGFSGTVSGLPIVLNAGTNVSVPSPVNLNFTNTSTGIRRMVIRIGSSAGTSDTITIDVDLKGTPTAAIFGDYNEVHVGSSVPFYAVSLTSGGAFTASPSSHITYTTGSVAGTVTNVTVNGVSSGSDSVIFTVTNTCGTRHAALPISVLTNVPPALSISSTVGSGIPGTTLVINGNNFNATTANNFVFFGNQRATVLSGSATSLSVTIPLGTTYASVTVLDTVSHLRATALRTFTPLYDTVAFQPSTLFNLNSNVSFHPSVASGTPKLYSVEYADIDGDGKSDLIVSGTGSDSIIVYRNISSVGQVTAASYATPLSFKVNSQPINVKIADFDADGKPDIAAACAGAGGVSIIRNTSTPGNISFATFFQVNTYSSFYLAGVLPNELSIGDFNNDGRPDIAVVHNGFASSSLPGSVYIIRNNYNRDTLSGTFISATDFDTIRVKMYTANTSAPISIASADLDADGKMDLVVSDQVARKLEVFQNTSSGTAISFATPVSINTGRDLPGSTRPCGLASYPSFPSANCATCSNSYTQGKTDYPTQVRIGDFDNDGKPDLVVSVSDSDLLQFNVHNNLAIFKNNGSLSFGAKQLVAMSYDTLVGSPATPIGASPVGIALADMDADGKLDIVNTNSGGGSMGIIKNTTTGGAISFATPVVQYIHSISFNGAPVGIAVGDVDGNTVPDIALVERGLGSLIILKQYPIPDTTAILTNGVTGPTGVDTVCLGSTITATSTHGLNTNGYWSGRNGRTTVVGGVGAADISATVTGASIGMDTIKYAVVKLFDTGFVTKRVYVKDTAHPGVISGAANVCVNASTTLTTTGANGVWGTSNPAVATVNAATGMVTGLSAGTVTISYTVTTSICGPVSALKSLTVDALPQTGNVISGSGGLCLGTTTSLTASLPSGTWALSDPIRVTLSAASGSPITASAAALGTDTVMYIIQSVSGHCGADTTIKIIDVITAGSATPINGTASVCQGASTVLTNAQPGGTWSSNNTSVATVIASGASAGTVSGVVAGTGGTADISYIVNYSCGTTTSVRTVTVNQAPFAPAISGPNSVCIGNTITLTNAGAVGTTTWTSSNTAAATVGASSGIVSGVANGTTIITDTVSNACGTVFTTKSISVAPTPVSPVISGSGPVCQGANITLTTSTGGGTWSSNVPSTTVSTVSATSAIVHGGSTGGVTIITYTDNGGCNPVSDTQAIFVNLLPNPGSISGTDSICFNSDTLTNATAVPAGTWSSRNLSLASIDAATGIVGRISNSVSGSDTIVYINTNSCGTDSARFTLRVNPVPVVGTITPSSFNVCQGNTITLTNVGGTPGGNWTTTTADTGTLSITGNVATGVHAGDANVIYNISTVCGNAAPSATIHVRDTAHAVISGAVTHLCSGAGDITLSNAGSVATSGVWSSSATGTATINSATGQLHAVAAGNTTITYIATTSCGSDTATLAFTVDAAANAGAITPAASALCTGGVVTLSSNGDAGGQWTSSNTSAATVGLSTGVVSGVVGLASSTTVTITYTANNSCNTSIATAVVTVNPTPSAGTVTGASAVCSGSSITLSIAATAGSWTSSDPSVATVTGAGTNVTVFGVSTVIASTPVTITYTATSTGCGNPTASQVVTVNPTPNAGTISGVGTVCAGSVTSLSSNGTSGGTWTSQNGAVATVNATGNVTGLTSGATNITYTVNSASCGSPFAIKPVTVNDTANAVISGAVTHICAGSPDITLSNAGSVATVSGVWSSSTPGTATINPATGQLHAVASGTTTITYIATTNCNSDTATLLFTVDVSANAGTINPTPASVCSGATISLVATGGDAAGTWSSNNTSVATVNPVTGQVFGVSTVSTSSTVTISYAVSNSCNAQTATTVVTVNPTPNAGTISGLNTVCAGTTITLSSNGTSGGTWSSSNSAVASVNGSGVVSASASVVASTSVTITYSVTSVSCGTSTTIYNITVNPQPNAGTITPAASSVCSGSVVTLSSNGDAGGSWSSNNNAAATVGLSTGIVSGVVGLASSTTVTITYSTTNSCNTATSTAVVTVNPTPNAGTISGLNTVCAGVTITLSSNGNTGGTWSSSNSAVASVNGSGVVSASASVVASTSVTITYSVTSVSCGTSTTIYNITVNPQPNAGTINPTPSSVCSGASAALTIASGDAGGTWSSSNTSVATVNISTGDVFGVSTVAASSTVTITYSVTNSCNTVSTSRAFTVNPTPNAGTISGPVTVCAGSQISLTTSGTIGSGTWSSSAPAAASVNGSGVVSANAGVTVSTPVTITFQVTSISCGSSTTVYNISVDPVPVSGIISGNSTVCSNSTVTLTTTGANGSWSSSNTTAASVDAATGAVYGGSSVTLTTPVTISYIVNTANCGSSTATHTMNVLPAINAGTITGLDSVCRNATIPLSNSASPTTLTWTSLNTSVASVNIGSGLVTGVSNSSNYDSTTIVYTATTTCGSAQTGHLVWVKPLPFAGIVSGPSVVCGGISIPLSTTGLAGGTWSSSAPSVATVDNFGTVTGSSSVTSSTSVTITYTSSTFSCGSASAGHAVTVNPQPVAGTITPQTAICYPLTENLTVTGSSGGGTGVWSSSNTSAASVDATTGFVTTNPLGGNTTIAYTLTNSCNVAFTSFNLAVNLPTVATINGHHDSIVAPHSPALVVCVGSTISIGGAPASGTFSLVNTSIATITSTTTAASATVKGLVAGIDTIKYTVVGPCTTNTSYYLIQVVGLPVLSPITGDSQLCQTTISSTFTDTATNGAWLLQNGIGFINPVSGVWNPTGSQGTDSVCYNKTNGCGTSQVCHYIFVNPPLDPGVISGADTICNGTSTSLTTSGTNGDYWSTSNTAIASVDSVTGIVTAPVGPGGVVSIFYTDTSFCGSLSTTHDIFVRGLPITGTVYSISGADTMCVGTSITITDTLNGGTVLTGGIWSVTPATVANISAAGVLTGNSGGLATIKYTLTNVCGANNSTYNVKVNAFPVFTSATSKTVCDSELLNYIPTADSANAHFTWTRAAVTGIANAAGSGVGNISEYLDNIADNVYDSVIHVFYNYADTLHGCVTNSVVAVAVNPTPHLTSAHTATVCSGAPFIYLDTLSTGTVGVTNTWTRPSAPNITPATASGSGNISETLTSSILTGATTTYIYTLAYGTCPSHTENLVVAVDPRPGYPQITTHSPALLCEGTMWQNFGSATVPPAGVNYSWSASNAEVWATGSTRQYSLVNFDKVGDAYVYLLATLPGFNCPSKDSFEVTVSSSVSDRPEVTYFNGDFICLSADQSSYQWGYDVVSTLDSELLDRETNQNYTNPAPDFTNKYYWVMTTHNGCSQKSYYIVPTGVKNVTASMGDMKIYPNPSDQFVNVEISNTSGGKYIVEVVNLVGQTISSENISGQKTTLDVANMASGVYFINCYRDGVKFASAKFVKN